MTPKRTKITVVTQCLYCKSDVSSSAKYVRRYCNMACANYHKVVVLGIKWEQGELDGSVPKTRRVAGYVRRHVIRRRGERCEKCGWSERHSITGNVPVELDHIDGDPTNNIYSNVRLLCPNCHSLTDTYRVLNSNSERLKNGLPLLPERVRRTRELYDFAPVPARTSNP